MRVLKIAITLTVFMEATTHLSHATEEKHPIFAFTNQLRNVISKTNDKVDDAK